MSAALLIISMRNESIGELLMFKIVLGLVVGLTLSPALAGGSHDHSHGAIGFGVGEPGEGPPDRRLDVSLRDSMRFVFDPALETLRAGETIEFVIRNDGAIRHEFSIGNAKEQARHAEMMRKMPNMKHEDPNTVSLEPGKTAKLKWRFLGEDTVVFACNIPGHFEAGMHHAAKIVAVAQSGQQATD